MTRVRLPRFIQNNYEVHDYKHALAILKTDFPQEYEDIMECLQSFRVNKSHIMEGGGGKSRVVQGLESEFVDRGWEEKEWETEIKVDDNVRQSPTHKVDCVKNNVAVEIEWSNKDPFFDRDLNNFRLLFDLRAISVGVIITKCDEWRPLMERLEIWSKYGTSTTWMSKLIPRIEGGGGGGCPVLVFGIRRTLFNQNG